MISQWPDFQTYIGNLNCGLFGRLYIADLFISTYASVQLHRSYDLMVPYKCVYYYCYKRHCYLGIYNLNRWDPA